MPDALRILALGDSYTIGEAVPAAERWISDVARRLRSRNIDVADPYIIATTGWTTDELDAAITADGVEPEWDLVTLLIGVNDQYRGRPVEEYESRFTSLLDRATTFAGGDASRVLVLSIPDWGVTPFAAEKGRDPATVAAEIDAYNSVARSIAASRNVRFIDITPISRRAATQRQLLAPDGLHPSGEMYQLWADEVMRVIPVPSPSAKR